MRNILLILLLTVTLGASAQQQHVMLFEQNTPGVVFLKSGMQVRVPMNYDAALHTMRYEENGQMMELQNVNDVDSIVIAGRRFISVGKHFCEFIPSSTNAGKALLVDWTLSSVHVGYKGAMGTTVQVKGERISVSQFGSGSNGSSLLADGSALENNNISSGDLDVYKKRSHNTYLLWENGKTRKFKDKKQLLKLFPDRTEEVEKVLRHHHADFQHPQTIIDAMMELLNSGN